MSINKLNGNDVKQHNQKPFHCLLNAKWKGMHSTWKILKMKMYRSTNLEFWIVLTTRCSFLCMKIQISWMLQEVLQAFFSTWHERLHVGMWLSESKNNYLQLWSRACPWFKDNFTTSSIPWVLLCSMLRDLQPVILWGKDRHPILVYHSQIQYNRW